MDAVIVRKPAWSALLAAATLALAACGGASGDGGGPAASPTQSPAAASSCSGEVRAFFAAIEGSYTATVDPEASAGTALPLKAGKTYPVSVAAAHCTIEIVGDGLVKLFYAYEDPANVSASRLTAITPTEVIQGPVGALDLTRNQYSISIQTDPFALELERLVATSSGEASPVTGDLRITLSAAAPEAAVYALDMPLVSKR